ncbi:uncharacterized protein C20orf96-like isoform X3 [Gigantopelta aegis]|uniref:uncharacterized protein C20orf96-like isoform X2 n=1 Tax=Gigantopelta aegis TaxID=1735272 RepID=UPI001B88DF24|nr:uncharacterized protein C20orf96-like isoform X2 [Gigantopelta aegis]XP_041376227.1 uncharacterized protein C20orf96-like isoform X3 [Gigantopelta aegis]
MATGGWGKRAATRIDRTQFEHDELLKSLGTQFNVDFTVYEQWQRQTKVVRPFVKQTSVSEGTFTVGHVKTTDSPKQLTTQKEKKIAAKLEEDEKRRQERMKILKLRLKTRKQTLDEYLKRFQTLLDENIKLKAFIDGDEKNTHDGVKKMLRRYEKYRGGMITLNTNFVKELAEVKTDFAETKKRLKTDITVLEKRISEVDVKLQAQHDELKVLLSYKDKEYPVKAIKISNLQKEIENLRVSNREEMEELEHIINTEVTKHEKSRIQLTNKITRNVTEAEEDESRRVSCTDFNDEGECCVSLERASHIIETAVDMMHPSLKEMALQNMVMTKEIEFHLKEQEEVESANKVLEDSIKELLRDPKTNTRLQMFPEFFPTREKCTPDMDVVLDIPHM